MRFERSCIPGKTKNALMLLIWILLSWKGSWQITWFSVKTLLWRHMLLKVHKQWNYLHKNNRALNVEIWTSKEKFDKVPTRLLARIYLTLKDKVDRSSMEALIPALTSDDFFEVYKLLVKTELLENTKSPAGSEILERFMQDLMNCK